MSQSYVELVTALLKGKTIEVYEGTNGKIQKWNDYDNQQKELIRGVLKDGVGDLLIVEVTDDFGNTNIAYINGWNVKLIVEPKNSMSMLDIYIPDEKKQVK